MQEKETKCTMQKFMAFSTYIKEHITELHLHFTTLVHEHLPHEAIWELFQTTAMDGVEMPLPVAPHGFCIHIHICVSIWVSLPW
jgi:hypothetical protein